MSLAIHSFVVNQLPPIINNAIQRNNDNIYTIVSIQLFLFISEARFELQPVPEQDIQHPQPQSMFQNALYNKLYHQL